MLFLPLLIFSQNNKTETDLYKKANKLFEEEKFVEAGKEFQKLLSINQYNAEYNYKYGTCLLYSDGNKAIAIKYLKFAAQQPNPPKEVFFYLGKAYHINYQFADAIKNYQKFITLATSKDKEKYQPEREIEMCNNGKKLLRNISDLIVIDKKEFRENEFFRLYDLRDIGGNIIVVDELQSSLDKKRSHRPLVHIPKNADIIYFASYGDNENTGKDIYRVKRFPDGKWAKPQPVAGYVNTKYDEDYPYMSPDGRFLYFCSKGHNSMGGYDVFRSYYDPNTETFGPPENVDFSINTPADDIFYIVDSLDQNAYFSSNRESRENFIHVYRVRVERIPVQLAIIKGKFYNEINTSNLSATITVEDASANDVIGIFNTRQADGNYLIILPKSGKYKFTVVSDHSKLKHTGYVEIPYQKELRPLKQELLLVDNNGQELLKIRNLFDEEVEDADLILAEVLKDKALLNPNASNFDLDSLNQLNNKQQKDEIVDKALPTNLSNEELVKMVKEDAQQLKKESEELKTKSEAAYIVANEKNEAAKDKARNAEKLLSSAENVSDPQERKQIIESAEVLNNDSKKLLLEAAAAFEVANKLDNQHKQKEKEAKISADYAKGIEDALNEKKKDEAIKKLKEQQDFIKKIMAPDLNKQDVAADTKIKAAQKQTEANKAIIHVQQLRNDEEQIQRKLKSLNNELTITKNEKRKKDIEKEIDRLKEDLSIVQNEVKAAIRKADALQKEADELTAQANLFIELENESITSTTNTKKLSEYEKADLANKINSDDVNKTIEKNEKTLSAVKPNEREQKELLNDYMASKEKYRQLSTKQEQIRNISNEKQRLEEENKLNNEWIDAINFDINELKTAYNSESNPQKKEELNKKINALENFKIQKEKEISINNSQIKDIVSNNNYNNINNNLNNTADNSNTANNLNNTTAANTQLSIKEQQEILAKTNPGFEKKYNEINNSNKSAEQKAKEQNKLLTESINYIDKEIASINKQINKVPEDKKQELEQRKVNLEKVKEQQQQTIIKNNEVIAGNTIAANNTSTNSTTLKKSEESNRTAENIDPGYNARIASINTNDKPVKENAAKRIEENENLMEKTKARIKELDEILANNPGNKTELESEKRQMEKLLDETNKEILADKQTLEIENNTQKAITQNLTVVNEIFPEYNEKQKEVNNTGNETQKINNKNKVNYELLKKIEAEIRKTENELAMGLISQEEAERKLKLLNELRSVVLENIKLDSKKLSDAGVVKEGTSTPVTAYNIDNSNYTIEAAVKDRQILIDKINVLQQLQSKIDELKIKIAETKNADEKQKLKTELTKEQEQFYKTENEVSATLKKINDLQLTQNTKDYNSILQKVKQNTTIPANSSAINRAEQLFNESDIKYTRAKEIRKTASVEKDKIKRSELLKQAAELEKEALQQQQDAINILNRINENPQLASGNYISNTSGNNIKYTFSEALLTNDVMPGYANKISVINKSDLSEQEKAEQRIKINEELTEKINNKILNINKQITETENEEDRAVLNSKKSALQTLKADKQNDIKRDEMIASGRMSHQQTIIATVETNEQDIVQQIFPEYYILLNDIENNKDNEINKVDKKIKLNKQLLAQLENEISSVKAKIITSQADYKQKLQEKLSVLEKLKSKTEQSIYTENSLLAKYGIINTLSLYNPHENEFYTSSVAKNELQKANAQQQEIQSLKNNITQLQYKLINTNNEKEKKSIENQIKTEQTKLINKEIVYAGTLEKINASESEALSLQISDKRKKVSQLPLNNNGNNALKEADKREKEAAELFAQASKYRQQATKQNDKNKKHELLINAHLAEKAAINKQKEEDQIYTILLKEYEEEQKLSAQNKNNPNYKSNFIVSNTDVPDNVELRPSAQQYKLAKNYRQEADRLIERSRHLEDSAKNVKKKNRQIVLDDAARLKQQAAELYRKADEANTTANNMVQQEEIILSQRKKEREENESRQQLAAELIKTNEYARVYDIMNNAAKQYKQTEEINNKASKEREIASNLLAESNELELNATNETDPQKKQMFYNQSAELRKRASNAMNKADSLENTAKIYQRNYKNAFDNTDNYLASIDKKKADDIRFVIGNEKLNLPQPEKSAPVILDENGLAKNFIAPARIENEIYVKTNKPAYSVSNPIPVNPKMPEGIFFKVQVGAFRNPIPQDLFKEFVPITGETTPAGLTRYTAGYFSNFKTADDAKKDIRKMGYEDAFVVAFCNGRRIPVTDAINGNCNGNSNNTAANNTTSNNLNNTANNSQNNNTISNTTISNSNNTQNSNTQNFVNNYTPDNKAADYYKTNPNAAKANQVEALKGLFFTVQVGVYSKPVSADKIFNINPLNSELTADGKIRYTTGVFTNFDNAAMRRDEIKNIGVSDAFVTAYFNGKRITVAQARDSIAKYGNSVFVNPQDVKVGKTDIVLNTNTQNNNNNNTQNINTQNNTNPNNNTNTNNINTTSNTTNTKRYVILGEYPGEVPAKDAEIYLNNMRYNIKAVIQGKKIIYYTEADNDIKANELKSHFTKQGLNKVQVSNTIPGGEAISASVNKTPKEINNLVFQVYLGEYPGEVPPEDALVFLQNSSKGIFNKEKDGFIIYYTCNCKTYDEALRSKAHFVSEGITTARIVAIIDNKEVSLSQALKMMYE